MTRVYLIWDSRDYYGPDPGNKVFDSEAGTHVDRPWVFASEEAAEAELCYRRRHYGEAPWGLSIEGEDVR